MTGVRFPLPAPKENAAPQGGAFSFVAGLRVHSEAAMPITRSKRKKPPPGRFFIIEQPEI